MVRNGRLWTLIGIVSVVWIGAASAGAAVGLPYPVLRLQGAPAIDGDLTESGKLIPVTVNDFTGPVTRVAATAWWGWTHTGVYLACRVNDKTPRPAPEAAVDYKQGYKYDAVEFWIGRRQFCAGAAADGPAIWSFHDQGAPAGSQLAIARNDDGYSVEILLPWAAAGIKAQVEQPLSLAVGVDDRADAKQRLQVYAPPSWIWGQPSSFARAVLATRFDPAAHGRDFVNRPPEWSVPDAAAMSGISIRVEPTGTLRPMSRQLFGVCAYAPPWSPETIAAGKPFLQGSSLRVWARLDRAWNRQWVDLANQLDPAWVLGFTDKAWHPEQIAYRSETANNLFGYQRPDAIVKLVAGVREFSGGRLNAYELWNEVEFKVNGHWPAEDYARYVNDCARRIHAAAPGVEVGAFLRRENDWNRGFLKHLDSGAIAFADRHYYNTFWFHVGTRGPSAYVGKIAYLDTLQREVHGHLETLREAAPSPIRLITSEWGIHPKGYGPPYDVCHDIGSVLYHAGALLTFAREGMAAAQYFHFTRPPRGKGNLYHFRLIDPLHPETATGNLRLFQAFGRWFHGDLVNTAVNAPAIQVDDPAKPTAKVSTPAVQAAAAYDSQAGRMCLVLLNVHPDLPAHVAITGIPAGWQLANTWRLSAPDLDTVDLVDTENAPADRALAGGSGELPPHSVLFLIWSRPTTAKEVQR